MFTHICYTSTENHKGIYVRLRSKIYGYGYASIPAYLIGGYVILLGYLYNLIYLLVDKKLIGYAPNKTGTIITDILSFITSGICIFSISAYLCCISYSIFIGRKKEAKYLKKPFATKLPDSVGIKFFIIFKEFILVAIHFEDIYIDPHEILSVRTILADMIRLGVVYFIYDFTIIPNIEKKYC